MSDIKKNMYYIGVRNNPLSQTAVFSIQLNLVELLPPGILNPELFGLEWLNWPAFVFRDEEDLNVRVPLIENYALGCLARSNMDHNTNYQVATMQWDTETGLERKLLLYLNPSARHTGGGSGPGSISPTPPNQPMPPLR